MKLMGNRMEVDGPSEEVFDFRFSFAPDPARADITVDADITPKGVMRLMAPLLGAMMRRTMARRPEQVSQGFRAWRTAQV